MLKAYKYRIYPNNEQKIQIAKTFGCCRFVYNLYTGIPERNSMKKRKNQLVKPTVTIIATDN